jgi:hypothetical protein
LDGEWIRGFQEFFLRHSSRHYWALDHSSIRKEAAMAWRLIFVPAAITLAVTILRLTGELQHWSSRWFSPETGGIIPSGVSWIFGITWLAAIFGAYFAVKLFHTGQGPRSLGKAVIFSAIGILIFLLYRPVVESLCLAFKVDFPQYLVLIWFFWGLAGVLQYFGWPELFKVLLIYAYAARIPVAIVMFFAMGGHWGTHYDYVGTNIQLSGIPRYLWLAFFPQLVGWIGFTITLGAVAGVLAIFLIRLIGLPVRSKNDRVNANMIS